MEPQVPNPYRVTVLSDNSLGSIARGSLQQPELDRLLVGGLVGARKEQGGSWNGPYEPRLTNYPPAKATL